MRVSKLSMWMCEGGERKVGRVFVDIKMARFRLCTVFGLEY